MDTKGYFSWSLLLVLSLAFGLSYVAGRGVMDCPKSVQQLGSNILLPLTNERINKSMNKSIRIVVTVAKSPESSVKRKIVSLDLSEGGSPEYVEDGYRFHPEDLKLGLLESRKEHEGWYFLSLEENTSVQQFCVQLSLYGNDGDFPNPDWRANQVPRPRIQAFLRSKGCSELEET